MLDDLLWHELEVVKSFYARALSWATAEAASESTALVDADEETIEAVVLHPHGSYNLEQIVVRSVINELNALCEFALQNIWRTVSKTEQLPNGGFVFTASRGAVEKALRMQGIDVRFWPRWSDVVKIKELSEGFKHRQRMQPFPAEFQKRGFEWRAKRAVDPENIEWLSSYDLKPSHAAESLAAVEELLCWLRMHYAL